MAIQMCEISWNHVCSLIQFIKGKSHLQVEKRGNTMENQWFSCEFPLNFPLSQAIGTFVARRGMSCPLKEVVGTSAEQWWAASRNLRSSPGRPCNGLRISMTSMCWPQCGFSKYHLAGPGQISKEDILNGHGGLFNSSRHAPFAISRYFSYFIVLCLPQLVWDTLDEWLTFFLGWCINIIQYPKHSKTSVESILPISSNHNFCIWDNPWHNYLENPSYPAPMIIDPARRSCIRSFPALGLVATVPCGP